MTTTTIPGEIPGEFTIVNSRGIPLIHGNVRNLRRIEVNGKEFYCLPPNQKYFIDYEPWDSRKKPKLQRLYDF